MWRMLVWTVQALWSIGVIAVPILVIQLLVVWFSAGYVTIEPGSEHLELAGAPGDRIKLRLPLPADARADYRETAAVMSDPETGVETITRLDVKLDSEEEPDRVFAWLMVPELRGDAGRTLNGTLSGYATTSKGAIGRFELPFTLRIGPPGSIATSGAKDMTWQNRVKLASVAALALGLLAGVAAGVIAVVHVRELHTANPGPIPETGPSTSPAHPASKGV